MFIFFKLGDPVRRAVWVQETGSTHVDKDGLIEIEYRPYPNNAAIILEDAYQYLKWMLSDVTTVDQSKHRIDQDRPSVMLTVQVNLQI